MCCPILSYNDVKMALVSKTAVGANDEDGASFENDCR